MLTSRRRFVAASLSLAGAAAARAYAQQNPNEPPPRSASIVWHGAGGANCCLSFATEYCREGTFLK